MTRVIAILLGAALASAAEAAPGKEKTSMNATRTDSQSGVLKAIGQVAVTVRDVGKATVFYRDVLGLPLLFTAPPGLAFFDCAGVRLLLGTAEGKEFRPSTTLLYFSVDDIAAARAALGERGVRFEEEPRLVAKLSDREVWIGVFRDPDGNPLALISEPRTTPEPR